MFSENIVISDIIAGALTTAITVSLLKLLEQTATRGVFEQKLNRKVVHISFGLVFMLCWPMFSSGRLGAVVASLIPAINIVNILLLGLGIWKDEATVKSMTRHGDHRELLKGPLYYASALTFFTAIYWRTSPIAIAVLCNVCAGDGVADIAGRRFGSQKLPYNRSKSFAGSVAMACAGFLASIGNISFITTQLFASSKMEFQNSGMLSRDQLLYLFHRFASLTSQPEVKRRIADAVHDKQEPVAVTTTIQEEIFTEMGVDPQFGLACLGKVNMAYEDDQDLMFQFYGFVAKEEIACEEAELGPERFAERIEMLQHLEAQQLEMLKHMRNFQLDDQSAILEKIRQQMENTGFQFQPEASLLSVEQIQDIVKRRVTPVFQPM